ncbi:MAG: type 2 isopentenyl-diphosphate Delta-isomerase [Bacteroidota bacterium]|nr:MAG: type 2 isopentenyl-diphosphate Delta-isomerase [Bacteroidota bacterium]
MEDRKKDHIELAFKSQTNELEHDRRFFYEPLLSPHPSKEKEIFSFLGKSLNTPIWVSSMTGGTSLARTINENIARVCKDFGMGMGLGSCRVLLDDDTFLKDFNVRAFIGDHLPFYANLGIAQVDFLLQRNESEKIDRLIDKLKADGLIVHVNPLQEWFQPEGNKIERAPIDIIEQLLKVAKYPIIVKEVGQGMGPKSLERLLQLPLQALEFGAYGGTNFSLLELFRADAQVLDTFKPMAYIGQSALQMVDSINQLALKGDLRCNEIILSGGIKTFLDGYYLMEKSKLPAIYGMASSVLKHAKESYEQLYHFIELQQRGLQLAKAYLRLNPDYHD